MAQCAEACGLISKPRVSMAQYEFCHQNREAAYNVRACFSVKSNWGAYRLLFHHMLRIFSYLFMSCFILKGKSFIPHLVSVAQRQCFHLRNWKIIKSSFCLLCVCCKAPASPYAFQFHTRAWRRRQWQGQWYLKKQDGSQIMKSLKNLAFNWKTQLCCWKI